MPRSVRASVYQFASLCAMVGQLVFTLAVGTEGWRGPSTAPHVESRGIDRHYAHNEATCVACTVLSLHAHGVTPEHPVPVSAVRPYDSPAALPPIAPVSQRVSSANPPRAPPQLS